MIVLSPASSSPNTARIVLLEDSTERAEVLVMRYLSSVGAKIRAHIYEHLQSDHRISRDAAREAVNRLKQNAEIVEYASAASNSTSPLILYRVAGMTIAEAEKRGRKDHYARIERERQEMYALELEEPEFDPSWDLNWVPYSPPDN